MSKLLQFYLKFWSKIYLNRVNPKIIAITGSVGKTSTKEAIFEVLKIKFDNFIRKSHGNLNNETGVPLAILGYKKSPTKFWQWFPIILSFPFKSFSGGNIEVLVLEMAADKPGDIKYLTSFVKPYITVLTNIGPAHLENFGTIEKIIQEKTDLIKVLPSDGWAVLNIDDKNVKKASFGGRWKIKTYAQNDNADLKASNIETQIDGFLPLTKFQLNNKYNIVLHTLGSSSVYSSLAAIACGEIFNMNMADIINGLKNLRPQDHRMKVIEGKKNTIIIDDSYNANPLSMRSALDILRVLSKEKSAKKIVILGDMLEIGKISDQAHKIIGEYAHEVADIVISCGNLAKKYKGDLHFSKIQEAGDYLLRNINQNDIILIKGSRAIGLEKITEILRV